MVWTMPEVEEKTPHIIAVAVDQGRKMESAKKSSTKKYIIIGVSSVIVAALILIGILVGIYMFTDAFNKITSMSMKINPNVNQNVDADLTANIVEYHVNNNIVDATFVVDYNSFLEVVKVVDQSGPICYVNQMNETEKVDLSQIKKPDDPIQKNFTKALFIRTKMPIPDTSFLNKKSRTMCKGISTYWVIRACPSTFDNGTSRKKRGICKSACILACKALNKSWNCSRYCWLADVGCRIWRG